MSNRLRIVDTTLRDGMHSVAHQFTPEQMAAIAAAMDDAGIDTIEVVARRRPRRLLHPVRPRRRLRRSLPASRRRPCSSTASSPSCCCPASASRKTSTWPPTLGAKVARIATHVTEADISEQHIGLAKRRGMEVMGFLMMAHMAPVETMVHNAKLMESYGADYVYVVDSSGYHAARRGEAARRGAEGRPAVPRRLPRPQQPRPGHRQYAWRPSRPGADVVDGSLRAMGAGGGNAPTETLVAVLTRLGIETGVDLYQDHRRRQAGRSATRRSPRTARTPR